MAWSNVSSRSCVQSILASKFSALTYGCRILHYINRSISVSNVFNLSSRRRTPVMTDPNNHIDNVAEHPDEPTVYFPASSPPCPYQANSVSSEMMSDASEGKANIYHQKQPQPAALTSFPDKSCATDVEQHPLSVCISHRR